MRTLSLCALALGLSFGANAQDTSRDGELVKSVTKTEMRYVIESAEYTVKDDLTTGVGYIGEDDTGLLFGVQGKACDDDEISCVGVEFFLILEGDFTADYANDVNQRWSAIKATTLDDKSLMLSRYIILDYGQTLENLRLNLYTTRAIAEQVKEENEPETPAAATSISWGDNSGSYANDDACDDARFHSDGDDWSYQRTHVLHDANDCRTLYERGEITLYLDFGDDSGEYANDGTCDDNRFTGEGRSVLTTDSHVMKDASDCISAYQNGKLNR